MILPKILQLRGAAGSPFDAQFILWQDDAQTVPYEITDPVTFKLGDAVFGQADGSVVVTAPNVVDVHLTHTAVPADTSSESYRLIVTDINGEPFFPVRGHIDFN